jgi:fengycin family lipopeptide synthetase D
MENKALNNEINQPAIADFISKLADKNIKLWVDGESLRYKAPKGELSPEILDDIKERKQAIIQYLMAENAGNDLYQPIEPVGSKEYYPLSPAQRSMFLLNQIDQESTAYNLTQVLKIEGELDRGRLEAVIQKLIKRHESLRTSFRMSEEGPVQQIHENMIFTLEYLEIEGTKAEIDRIITGFIRPFDLAKPPLFRFKLLKLKSPANIPTHFLLQDMHHIISDGISEAILVKEVNRLYAQKSLPELKIQYKDYVAWNEKLLASYNVQAQKKFWLEQLSGEIPVLNLPADYQRPSVFNFAGDSIDIPVAKELAGKLRQLSRENRVTLYTVLLAAYYILLFKYTGQTDIIVGTPVAGRKHADTYNMIGVFVNTVVLRNFPEPGKTFGQFLLEVNANVLQAFDNQEYPFEQLVEELKIQRDLSRNPLFDTMFNLLNIGMEDLTAEGLEFTQYDYPWGVAQFDLTVLVLENVSGLRIQLNYYTGLFSRGMIEKLGRHYLNILEVVAGNPAVILAEIDILTPAEKRLILHQFNDTTIEYPAHKTIHELFELQAQKAPDNLAVVFEEQQITYGELNQKANQIAELLRGKGVGPDKVVGLLVNRSLEMITGIMGIIKAGGAYLPIDPAYPQNRVITMLQDSGASFLLTGPKEIEGLSLSSLPQDQVDGGETSSEVPHSPITDFVNPLFIDQLTATPVAGANLPIINQPKDLAYVIYTSGSTGKPKGVMIEHQSVINLVAGLQREVYQNYPTPLNVALLAPYVFDASVQQIFATLLLGHALHIVPDEVKMDGKRLLKYYEEHRIEISDGTPIHIGFLAHNPDSVNHHIRVKHFIIGGEALPLETVKMFFHRYRESKPLITNVYGPTECCVDATSYLVTPDNLAGLTSIPIGKPLANHRVYILGKSLELLPVGAPGELYIGGDGLSRGYINNHELTMERFVPNPFIPVSDGAVGAFRESPPVEGQPQRIYKTGDLARWLPDGNLEFLGRTDHQVKIRGYRIELGEIEKRLVQHKEIQDSLVVVKEDHPGDKYLLCYYVARQEIAISELRNFLAASLPGYMVPERYVHLTQFPLTPNGKINRSALPDFEGVRPDLKSGYSAPVTDIEKTLAGICQEILNISLVGVDDNFFDLGGNSLKLIQMQQKIEAWYPDKVRIIDLFTYPTVAKLAEFIKNTEAVEQAVKLTPLKFPAQYFIASGEANEDTVLKVAFEEKQYRILKQTAVENGLHPADIFLATYFYLLSAITEQPLITVQTMMEKENLVRQLTLDLTGISDLFAIFNLVKAKRAADAAQESYPASVLGSNPKRPQDNEIFILFSWESSFEFSMDIFDLILEFSENEHGIDLYCEYDAARLRKRGIEELILNYLKLLETIASKISL